MKLCADILYWRLKEELKAVELHGAGSMELTLSRPEFYLDRTQTFEKNRVYVCSADHLPTRPSLRENVCLVCLGQHWNLTAFYDRCSVIVVETDTDIFRVFNLVQRIFDRYEVWEETLWHILRHGASLPQMLEVSRSILSNPMLLIGSDFRYLAVTDEGYFQKISASGWIPRRLMRRKWRRFCPCTTFPPMSMNRSYWSCRARGRFRSMCSIRRNISAA